MVPRRRLTATLMSAACLAVATVQVAFAQAPTPTPAMGVRSGTMGAGAPASMSGEPVMIALSVIALGVGSMLVTAAILRILSVRDSGG